MHSEDTSVHEISHQPGRPALPSCDADAGLSFHTNFRVSNTGESPVTAVTSRVDYFFRIMPATTNNIIQFPLQRRREYPGCPQCGASSDVWQIGRLLWGYCEAHEVRWVVANYESVTRATINRREMRRGLEFLSSFVEVSY